MTATASSHQRRRGRGDYVTFALVIIVVLVVYWEEVGLANLFQNNGGSDASFDTELKLLKTSTDHWSVWDGESILFNDQGYTCQWVTFKSQFDTSKTVDFCAHEKVEYISGQLAGRGNYRECKAHLSRWDAKNTDKQTIVEVGAHIGACTMEFLLNTKAKLVLFEPLPKNLFVLTSTLLKHPAFKDRVTLFPIALGKQTVPKVYLELVNDKNFASARIQTTQGTGAAEVSLERLDNVLNGAGIQLLKINVAGYECHVIEGAVKTIHQTPITSIAITPEGLENYKCSTSSLVAKMESLQHEGKWYKANGRLRPLPTGGRFPFQMITMHK